MTTTIDPEALGRPGGLKRLLEDAAEPPAEGFTVIQCMNHHDEVVPMVREDDLASCPVCGFAVRLVWQIVE